jgi:hypothetical protein
MYLPRKTVADNRPKLRDCGSLPRSSKVSIECWLQWNAATECNAMLPLAACPMHYYPATDTMRSCRPVQPNLAPQWKLSRLSNSALGGVWRLRSEQQGVRCVCSLRVNYPLRFSRAAAPSATFARLSVSAKVIRRLSRRARTEPGVQTF